MPSKIKTKPAVEEQLYPAESKVASVGVVKFYRQPLFMVALLAMLAIVVAAVFAWQNAKLKRGFQNQPQTPEASPTTGSDDAAAIANKQLIAAVGKLIILPQDEQPTIATVADLEKLKDQPFFQNAALGDKVLIYTQAKKAILYRPSENKIIELAPLNIGDSSEVPSSQQLKVEIRNGSGVGGAGQNFKTKLTANKNFSVTGVGNANTTYPKTILYVAATNKFPELVKTLRQMAGAELVTALPAGEKPTSADALLILGQQ